MRAFWASGYDGASMDRLSRETRMPRASIYQHYHDKEGLFLAAVDHYANTRLGPVARRLEGGGTLGEDLLGFLSAVITLATCDPETRGCLISCVLADAAGSNPRLRNELARRFDMVEGRLADRLNRARTAQELPQDTDTAALALCLASLARGLMLRARSGTPLDALMAAAVTGVSLLNGCLSIKQAMT